MKHRGGACARGLVNFFSNQWKQLCFSIDRWWCPVTFALSTLISEILAVAPAWGKDEGPWRAPCQLKKSFKALRPRRGSFWEKRKGIKLPNEGVINLPSWQSNDFFTPPNIRLLGPFLWHERCLLTRCVPPHQMRRYTTLWQKNKSQKRSKWSFVKLVRPGGPVRKNMAESLVYCIIFSFQPIGGNILKRNVLVMFFQNILGCYPHMLAPYQTTLGHCICDEPLCNLANGPRYHFIVAWALLAQTIATKL